jgi:hypothetical protein
MVFATLSGPALVWPYLRLWAQAKLDAWTPAAGDLSLLARVGIYLDNWAIRFAPLAVVLALILGPLVVLGVAALTRVSSPYSEPTRGDVLAWWCVSLAVGGILPLSAGRNPFGASSVFFSVLWTAVVAFWVSLAAAYGIQREGRRATPHTWHPGWLLGLAAVPSVGVLLLPILAFTVFRPAAVESGRLTTR